jgi:hypothetical protein
MIISDGFGRWIAFGITYDGLCLEIFPTDLIDGLCLGLFTTDCVCDYF